MSLNSILNIANSGLATAQAGLRTTSDNVANVSTPGYVRKVVDQQSVSVAGVGAGVSVAQVRLAADRFLQAASLSASANAGRAGVSSDILDRAQSALGDPNSTGSFLAGLDGVFSAFSSLSATGTSAGRAQALASVQAFLSSAQGVNATLTQLGAEADTRIREDVATANDLLQQIDALNADISRGSVAGGDVTGSQNRQSLLIDQLSKLVDVRVSTNATGGAVVRAGDGTPLAGDGGAATLRYETSGSGTGRLLVTFAGATAEQPLGGRLGSGEIKGLLDLKNTDLPQLTDGLSSLVSGAVEALNIAHNAHSSVPAPNSLSGRATGLTQAQAVGQFATGKTAILITDATGAVQRRVDVDFGAGTLSVDGGAATAFAPASFATSLSTALGSFGSASFDGTGALKITASAGANGVAIADDATTPPSADGKGFSAWFGLNDLVTAPAPIDYDTGIKAADPANFTGAFSFRISAADGTPLREATVTPTAGQTIGQLVTALSTAAQPYGGFALDANGRLAFTPQAGAAVLDVTADTTARGTNGQALSTTFGLDAASRANRLPGLAVRSDIVANPSRLALATVQAGAATGGAAALYATDRSGADALAQAGGTKLGFDAAGGVAGGANTASGFAAQFAAATARKASAASTAQDAAKAVSTEADARRSSAEGVNLDQELVSLTTYQQSYNASARLIQAAKDIYDVLLNLV